MYSEIEAKLKIESPEQIEKKLLELGAEFIAEQQQTDYHFDDDNGSMRKGDKALRLRKQTVGEKTRFILTYKGPKEKSNFKKRQEIELELGDAETAEKLLVALGYHRALEVKKIRRLWKLDDCEVALDKLDLLGDFVEIEGPDDERITAAQKRLGLSDLPHIPKGYAAMVRAKQREARTENPT
jgi:adenylate cyclase class 2